MCFDRPLQIGIGVELGRHFQQRIDHRIAGDVDVCLVVTLAQQVLAGAVGRRKMQR